MKKIFSIFFLNSAIILTTLLILILSYAYFIIPYKIIQQGGENQRVVTKGDPLVLFDEEIGFRANNNSTTLRDHRKMGFKFKIVTDDTGARISNRSIKKNYSDHSIIAIGGSITWGHGVNYENTFSSMLEKKLNTRVKNYAMGSYGTLQAYKILKKKNNNLNSKLIIYGFIDDHLNRNIRKCMITSSIYCVKNPRVIIDEKNGTFRTPKILIDNVSKTQRYAQRLEEQKLFAFENFTLGLGYLKDSFFKRLNKYEDYSTLDQKLKIEKYLIEKMNTEAKNIGAKLLIVNVGIGFPRTYYDKIINMNFDDNILFLDASTFTGFKDNELLIKIDAHPNSLGHELMGKKIYKFINEKKLIN